MRCVFDDKKQQNKLLQIFVKRYAVYNDIANKMTKLLRFYGINEISKWS